MHTSTWICWMAYFPHTTTTSKTLHLKRTIGIVFSFFTSSHSCSLHKMHSQVNETNFRHPSPCSAWNTSVSRLTDSGSLKEKASERAKERERGEGAENFQRWQTFFLSHDPIFNNSCYFVPIEVIRTVQYAFWSRRKKMAEDDEALCHIELPAPSTAGARWRFFSLVPWRSQHQKVAFKRWTINMHGTSWSKCNVLCCKGNIL